MLWTDECLYGCLAHVPTGHRLFYDACPSQPSQIKIGKSQLTIEIKIPGHSHSQQNNVMGN